MSELQERYDIKCPNQACGYEMQTAPSIFHHMGAFDLGGGNCPRCGVLMRITYKPDTDTMVAEKYTRKTAPQENTTATANA